MSYPRVCSICEHFEISLGEPGFSEATPGAPVSIECAMQNERGCAWPKDYEDISFGALRTVAERCTLFKPHHDLEAHP